MNKCVLFYEWIHLKCCAHIFLIFHQIYLTIRKLFILILKFVLIGAFNVSTRTLNAATVNGLIQFYSMYACTFFPLHCCCSVPLHHWHKWISFSLYMCLCPFFFISVVSILFSFMSVTCWIDRSRWLTHRALSFHIILLNAFSFFCVCNEPALRSLTHFCWCFNRLMKVIWIAYKCNQCYRCCFPTRKTNKRHRLMCFYAQITNTHTDTSRPIHTEWLA